VPGLRPKLTAACNFQGPGQLLVTPTKKGYRFPPRTGHPGQLLGEPQFMAILTRLAVTGITGKKRK